MVYKLMLLKIVDICVDAKIALILEINILVLCREWLWRVVCFAAYS